MPSPSLWQEETKEELSQISAILAKDGYSLSREQPHLSGERFLMTREKLVLVGEDRDKARVIIKASRKAGGREEIKKEKAVRDLLSRVSFAGSVIRFPRELYHKESEGYLIWITEFIDQEKVFGEYPIEEQFFMILRELEAQEGFYANTFEHLRMVKGIFEVTRARDYLETFERFGSSEPFSKALRLMSDNLELIETRSNYVAHTDFAPSNFRISGREIYLIDLSSLHFGNKYEGWARFLNYCTIHNPELESLLIEYVKNNRGSAEYECLRLMRIYKAGYLLDYYSRSLAKTEGDLYLLTEKRLSLWLSILESLVADKPIDQSMISQYRKERDALRSPEEMDRQKEFNIPSL